MVSREVLHHFRCVLCDGWWCLVDVHIVDGIDGPTVEGADGNRIWYCPWCGTPQRVSEKIPATGGVTLPKAR